MALEQIVQFEPAWDKRSDDPKKDYGIHGVELRMVLKGDKGATQFVLYTGWLLPSTLGLSDDGTDLELYQYTDRLHERHSKYYPSPADLGYHAKEPRYEGQEDYVRTDCEYTGGVCYYDGSSLNAYYPFRELLTKGSDGVWAFLEMYYNHLFEGGEWKT